MDTVSGRTESSIAELLVKEGSGFEFFQAVRLLSNVAPGRFPVGGAAKPEEEIVRFSSRVSLEFPASAIHEITPTPPSQQPRMTVTFMGLMGVNGVLPIHYTEWMVMREYVKDTAMAAFFDIFNHRWISIFYRAWEKHQLTLAYEKAHGGGTAASSLYNYLFAFVGLGAPQLRNRQAVKDEALLYYAGLACQKPRSASALCGVLGDYFRVGVEIDQMLGSWCELEPQDRSYLDQPGLHNQLGVAAIAGDAVWDSQGGFRLRLGPLSFRRFCDFLPGARASRELPELVRFFTGSALSFETQLVLRGAEVPACRLGEMPPRLGWDSWLAEEPFEHDATDAIFAAAA